MFLCLVAGKYEGNGKLGFVRFSSPFSAIKIRVFVFCCLLILTMKCEKLWSEIARNWCMFV